MKFLYLYDIKIKRTWPPISIDKQNNVLNVCYYIVNIFNDKNIKIENNEIFVNDEWLNFITDNFINQYYIRNFPVIKINKDNYFINYLMIINNHYMISTYNLDDKYSHYECKKISLDELIIKEIIE